MSTFAYCPNYPNELVPIGVPGDSLQSKETDQYRKTIVEKILEIAEPIFDKTFFGRSIRAIKNLERVLGEVFEQIDEGHDLTLDRATFRDALTFMLLLPDDLELPELEFEDNGHITMEWYTGKWNIFTVIVDGSGVYYYAGLFGSRDNRDKGRKPFSEGMDEGIVRSIRKVQG